MAIDPLSPPQIGSILLYFYNKLIWSPSRATHQVNSCWSQRYISDEVLLTTLSLRNTLRELINNFHSTIRRRNMKKVASNVHIRLKIYLNSWV